MLAVTRAEFQLILIRTRQPFFYRRQRRERLVRLQLIPVRRAGDIVGAVVGVAVLDGNADASAEVDGVLDMEAVVG